ncbi:MAG: hypothetical protein SFU83_08525 [Meiothermus sp.]|nr:hypothetical protein [Meiothermus sp.]
MKLLWLIGLLMLFGIAQAQKVQFGVKLGYDFPQIVGIGLRADFEEAGLRLMGGGLFGIYTLEAHGYYRFSTDINGSGGYAGVGGGMLANFSQSFCRVPIPTPISLPPPGSPAHEPQQCSSRWAWPFVSGLLGYEWVLGGGFRVFLELRPIYQLSLPNTYPGPAFQPAFGAGIVWWF